MKKVNWRSIAKKRWSKAEWITGNGPYALLAWCRVLTVTLWSSLQEAHRERELIDQIGCGGEDEVDRVKGGVGWIQGCPAMILIRGWPEPGSSAVTRRGNR